MKKTKAKWTYGSEIKFTAPKRKVHTIFLHCSASDSSSHDDISVIKDWHVSGNGWSHVGYHFFINKSGNIQEGCSIEGIPIAQKGHNTGSIAICLHGLKKAKFTQAQLTSVKKLCEAIVGAYDKKIRIRGHCEVSAKACPVFDYKKTLGLNAQGYIDSKSEKSSGTSAASDSASTGAEAGDMTIVVSKKAAPIRIFSKGPHVQSLQLLLTGFGFLCGKDGKFGKETQEKVIAFQRNRRLQADGIVGVKTVDAMFSSPKVLLKVGDRNTDVRVLQLLLAMYGKMVMHDGIFGQGTYKALRNQQRLLGAKVDGVFGSDTRSRMVKKPKL